MTVDDSTFEQIVNAYYQPLYRFAFTLTHSEAQAWDLTQETFRKFATKGHQLAAQAKAKSWLFTTLYREFIDGHRRDSRLEPLDNANMKCFPSLSLIRPISLMEGLPAKRCSALGEVES